MALEFTPAAVYRVPAYCHLMNTEHSCLSQDASGHRVLALGIRTHLVICLGKHEQALFRMILYPAYPLTSMYTLVPHKHHSHEVPNVKFQTFLSTVIYSKLPIPIINSDELRASLGHSVQ